MSRRWLLRTVLLFAAAPILLAPTRAAAQFVVGRPGWGGLGGYWGRPYSPVAPFYYPAGFGFAGAFGGGYGYSNYLFQSYFPTGYATNPFLTAGYRYPGLLNYGYGLYPDSAVNTPVPGWAVGPATGSGGSGFGGPRMRATTATSPTPPAITGGQFIGPVPARRTSEPAVVTVSLPDPDAEVWVEGARTRQTGTQRRYVSPPLTPGSDYVYAIRARWRDKRGAVQLHQQNVVVQAGARVRVAFPTGP
jgi:uncharacterized protein (TIGR03000 family)